MAVRQVDFGRKEFRSDPYPLWEELRHAGPVHREVSGGWLVVTHAAAEQLLRDPRTGKDLRLLNDGSDPGVPSSASQRYMDLWTECRLPSIHRQWRRLVQPGFTPKAVASLREPMRRIAEDLLDAAPADGSFDLMTGFARTFPVAAVASVLGLDSPGTQTLLQWSDAIGAVLEPGVDAGTQAIGDAAFDALADCIIGGISRRRRQPADDFLTGLIAGADETLTDQQLVATIMLLFLSGIETSAALVGNGVLALSDAPEQADLLRTRPELMPSAIEEILRFDGPACIVVRATYEPVRVDGVQVPAGELLLFALGSANRDPARFHDPDRLVLDRRPNRHLAFGTGDHHCAGTGLARMEATVAMEALIARFPLLEVDKEAVRWMDSQYLRGPAYLPVMTHSMMPSGEGKKCR
ncbi:cytochrome P450 [Actinoplanes sichuanensis]|uniref:Cytochrome P450 n=1 Tax=Actinoplanes sichuanensis TaxID=512349 RepID=A0ABW4ARX2_9ACTN|nr:cytochrome P450 [Actinoplanes sichuanensis]BEL07195.1 cytochrome P450 [Actinoplanes sichuanensis]